MLILSALFYLALSGLLSLRVFKTITFSRTVIFFFLTAVSLNILVGEIMSLLGMLDQGWLFLLIQLLLCVAAGLLLWDPQQRIFHEKLPAFRFKLEVPRGLDWLLVVLIAGVLILCLYIGALAPINNSDSLHTHLPRIYYWIQHGSLASWDAITVTQLNYPVNLSLQGVWLFLLGGSEKLLFLMPWLALLAAVVLIREIALQLGASERGGLLAALISLSFPVVLLQTFSYQADVFVATLVLSCVFLLLQFIREKIFMFAFLSLWPLAVALGTKQTAFLFLPFYLVILLIYFVREKVKFRRWLVFGGVFLLFFGVFSSYKFIQNYVDRDRLETSMFASYRYKLPFSEAGAGRRYATNALRYLYQGISVDGLTGSVKLAAERGREQAFRALSRGLRLDLEVNEYISEGDAETFRYAERLPLNEDAAWFGPLSVLLLPVVVIVVLTGRHKPQKKYLLVALLFLVNVFLIVSVLITGWSPTNGRYLILPTLLMAPLYSVLLPQRRAPRALVTIVLGLIAGGLAFSSLLINDSRPLVTQSTLYTYQQENLNRSDDAAFLSRAYTYINDRVIEDLVLTSPDRKDIKHQDYYENLFHQSAEDIPDVVFINTKLPPGEPLYALMQKSIIEYALFGVNKTRDLHPVKNLDQVPVGALVLVDKQLVDAVPAGMQLIAENDHYRIMRKD